MKKNEMFNELLKMQEESEEEFEIITDLGIGNKSILIVWK